MLASGDPFWFGAGSSVTQHLEPGEWVVLPSPSVFSQAAAVMGWPLECTICAGLHAAPFTRIRPDLASGARLIVTLRDGAAVRDFARYVQAEGFVDSTLTVMESLGGSHEKITHLTLSEAQEGTFHHPVCAAINVRGQGHVLPLASGRDDAWFDSDGTMTKRPVRALTLSALAPKRGEYLWDIGGGSGSIAIEWLLSDPSLSAASIEPRSERAERITDNAARLGVDRLSVVHAHAPQVLDGLEQPDVVFIGGSLSEALLDWLETHLTPGSRLVANAVTVESEALVMQARTRLGGDLLRIELSNAAPLGPKQGWKASYPIVQWSVTL